ncbi:MAG: hypothetical protein V3S69_02010, partial [Dehalococcoidales bacterium]
QIQRMGAIGRTFSLFMTARLALFRGELRAFRQFSRGKISKGEFIKRFAVYHIIIPSLIQAVASGFRFEKDDQITAMILGQLNTFLIFGDLIYDAVYLLVSDSKRHNFGDGIPIVETAKEFWDGMSKMMKSGGDVEEVLEATGEILGAMGKGAGVPVDQGKNILLGGIEISEGNFVRGGKQILGTSPRVAKKSTDGKSSAATARTF